MAKRVRGPREERLPAAPAQAGTPDAAGSSGPPARVVIVGAGFGGLATARGLADAPARVTLIDRRNHHLFQPLLYQVATAALSPADIAEPIRRMVSRHRNIEVVLGEVTAVDGARREVLLGERRIGYDVLVLATGATHSYFGHAEWARHTHGLKTIEDARAIRTQVLLAFEHAESCPDADEQQRLMTIAIIGAGPTGVEMAGAIAELARHTLAADFRNIRPETASVLLIEAGPRVLPAFPPSLSRYAERALGRLGVTVLTGTPVEDVGATGITVSGRSIAAGTVIWAAGVAASPAGRWLGVATDAAGRVTVAPDLSVPGLSEVYVIGDVALCRDERGEPLPGLAQVAKQQGDYLGRALRRRLSTGRPARPFRFHNRGNLATIGRNSAVADFGRVRLTGFVAWALWGVVHVYLLIGFRHRLLVSLEWLWAYLTFQRGARLITSDARPP